MALPHALARHLDQAEIRHGECLGARAIAPEVRAKLLEHLLAVRLRVHVDEVAHDDAADVAQAELSGDLARRLDVRLEARLLRSFLPTKRPEFTSIETSASVGSMIR